MTRQMLHKPTATAPVPTRVTRPSPGVATAPATVAPNHGSRDFAAIPLYPPAPIQRKVNATGLPDRLKDGLEATLARPMDHVRVHYNSPQPAGLQADAFTQGADIHLAPGQEQNLPHEAWHVVQQAHGRVRPMAPHRAGAINTDQQLEHEADLMGAQLMTGSQGRPTVSAEAKGSAGSAARGRKEDHSGPSPDHAGGSGAPVTQLKPCKHCGYEGGHAPTCTPETRAAANAAREAANSAAADQSNDNRTRRDQSHRHHGNKNQKRAWK